MIFQLTYSSKAKKNITATDIDNILSMSTKNNRNLKISGCLLFYNYNFYQIIEGDKKDILALFKKIKQNILHHDVTLIATSHTQKRLYKDWGMLYYSINKKLRSKKEVEQLKNNLLLLESLTETSTEAEIWFWREIKKELLLSI